MVAEDKETILNPRTILSHRMDEGTNNYTDNNNYSIVLNYYCERAAKVPELTLPVRVQFNEEPTQDRFNQLNDVLHGILKAHWSRGDERWELPQTLPRNGTKENDDKKTDKN